MAVRPGRVSLNRNFEKHATDGSEKEGLAVVEGIPGGYAGDGPISVLHENAQVSGRTSTHFPGPHSNEALMLHI